VTVRRIVVDHVLLVVGDLEVSRRFYRAALAPLGIEELRVEADGVSFGAEGLDDFAIYAGAPVTTAAHVAFDAPDREAVDAFHAAALASGGRERGAPGTVLRRLPEPEQDRVIARLLRRLWRAPAAPHPFRPLEAMTASWSDETLALTDRWPDPGLVRAGLALFGELPRSAPARVLLATDLHAGNVLRARREPWLVIDPKPFVGDPAYDATQHLFNCEARLFADPHGTIRGFAEQLGAERERVSLWLFARAAAEPRDYWDDELIALARALAP
jgi:catechol 2,3-dioxygenase-like lactoylglutathione lyase family enzyme